MPDTEERGIWQTAQAISHFAEFGPRGDASFSTTHCSFLDLCVATGDSHNGGTFTAYLTAGIGFSQHEVECRQDQQKSFSRRGQSDLPCDGLWGSFTGGPAVLEG
jgi:hypothetical protein